MPPPFLPARASQTGHLGPKSSILPVRGAYDVFYVKMGPRRPNDVKNGQNVKGHGQ